MTTDSAPPVGGPTRVAVPSAARRGALAMVPFLAAYVPFALVIGSAVAGRGGPLVGWAGSWLILGGSAHLAAIRTLGAAGPVAAIVTGLLINGRLLVYSASLAQRWAQQPRWFRVAAAGLIIDPTWAAAELHARQCDDLRQQRRYFLGAGLTLACGWSGAMAVGAVLRRRLARLDLEIFVPLCLVGLLGAGLRSSSGRPVIVVSAVVALVTTSWPASTGLLTAVVAGGLTALVHDRGTPS